LNATLQDEQLIPRKTVQQIAAFQRERNAAVESPMQLISEDCNRTYRPSRLFPSGLPTALNAAQADTHMLQIHESPRASIAGTENESLKLASHEREKQSVLKV
jgi:hypothetical protein